jgi:hypothetical protein
MVAPEDNDVVAWHVHVNAGRLWAGGVATAVLAALAVLAGVLITRGVLGIPVLAPKTANNFGNSATAVYALLAAGATLLATALLHLLLLGTPRPRSSRPTRETRIHGAFTERSRPRDSPSGLRVPLGLLPFDGQLGRVGLSDRRVPCSPGELLMSAADPGQPEALARLLQRLGRLHGSTVARGCGRPHPPSG